MVGIIVNLKQKYSFISTRMAIGEHKLYIPLEQDAIIWRYISFAKFESLLSSQALFFCRADKFSDVFEGSLTKKEAEFRIKSEKLASDFYGNEFDEKSALARIQDRAELHKRFKRGTVVNCWHINKGESDGMWQLYLKDNEGVAIQSNCERITECFDSIETRVEMSKVRYLDYSKDIWYHENAFPHTSYNMITPLLHKRVEFIHESEFRIFVINDDAINNEEYWGEKKGSYVKIDIGHLIERVIAHPTADEAVINKLTGLIDRYGYKFKLEKSVLSEQPYF